MNETNPLRIVSLLPGLTELVYKLGCGNNLVGRSHECDFPQQVTELPVLTEPKYTHTDDLTSSQIQSSVSDLLQQGLSVYKVFEDKLKECDPDVVLTQDHCEVCAVSMKELSSAIDSFLDKNVNITSVEPSSLEEVLDSFITIAEAVNRSDAGKKLVDSTRARFNEIRQAVENQKTPTVVSIEWLDPLMTGGNWMPELIEIAGGKNLLSEPGKHSPWIEWDKIRNADPDILLILPCGFTISKTLVEINSLVELDGWNELKAVKNGDICLLDGNHYFNRPGPRILDSAEILAEIFHPELFKIKYENEGWMRFNKELYQSN